MSVGRREVQFTKDYVTFSGIVWILDVAVPRPRLNIKSSNIAAPLQIAGIVSLAAVRCDGQHDHHVASAHHTLAAADIEDETMCEFNYQVFVSYARDDRSQVQTIVDALKSIGLKVWLDDDGIPPGVNFPVAIMEALRESRHLVVAVSTHTKSSLWQSQEVSQFLAMQNQRQQRSAEPSRRLLIVVVLAPPPPEQEWPTFIPENLNRITLGDGDDLQQKEAMRRLLDTCRLPGLIPDNDPDTRPRIDELITSPNDPLTYIGQLLELVDNLGGRVSYSMSGLAYGNSHSFFDSIRATRHLLRQLGSPLLH